MGVAHYAARKEKSYNGIGHAHTYRVNKDIAGFNSHGFDADAHISNHLPKESEAWVVLCLHSVMSSKFNKLQFVLLKANLCTKALLDFTLELLT